MGKAMDSIRFADLLKEYPKEEATDEKRFGLVGKK